MSYILDALRRADAERERGAVPGLHAQQDPFELPEAPAEKGRPTLLLAVVLLALALVGVLGWTWWRAEPPVQVVAAQAPPPPVPGAAPLGVPAPAPEAVAEAAQSATGSSPATQPLPSSTTDRPPPRTTQPRAAPARRDAPREPAPGQRASAEASQSPSRPAPANASRGTAGDAERSMPAAAPTAAPAQPVREAPRVYAVDELPAHIRSELPRLAIGGASYSENAASRMLIINGQVFHEHDKLGPNHSLEEIRLKYAVLDYRGYRYRLTF
jgi:general secretion pathway protein B